MLGHVDFGGSFDCVDQRVAGERTIKQSEADAKARDESGNLRITGADGNGQIAETDDDGFGLGLPGLASLTLPSESMVVPPLNFSMVSVHEPYPYSRHV